VRCLSGRNLSEFGYVSIGQQGPVPLNVKWTVVSRLENIGVYSDK
jgi:hypothetical protein